MPTTALPHFIYEIHVTNCKTTRYVITKYALSTNEAVLQNLIIRPELK